LYLFTVYSHQENALKGLHITAQGNALGMLYIKFFLQTESLRHEKRHTRFVAGLQPAISHSRYLTQGVALGCNVSPLQGIM